MPYFNLMSAINLYVAVDWQGDREIERAGGRLQRETRSAEGEKELRAGDAKAENEREVRGCGERNEKWEGKRQYVCVFDEERERKRIHTQAADIPPFLLIEIQFKRSKPGNSEEIKLSQYYRERTISASC